MIPSMTDRGTPITDGATACPFVAFDDDRDTRSTAPDHRHRCYAEPVPAPRAIAHQDAYCLSPAFAVCPTFQDWARREAAAARPASPSTGPAPRPREDETSGPVPLPPADREPRHAPLDPAQPIPPRRVPRDWAAPPPWAAGSEDNETSGHGSAPEAPGAIPGWDSGAGAAGAAGAGTAGAAGAAASRSWADARSGEGRGLADSAAARLAGPDPDLPPPARPTPSWAADPAPAAEDDDEEFPAAPQAAPRQPVAPSRAARPSQPPIVPIRDGARPAPRDAQDLFGPAWERPRRYEAYPTLKTRVGLPSFGGGVPRLAIAAVALVIAAAFLFFVSPMLLGLGKHGPAQPSAAASGVASAVPSATPVPTITPSPRPTVYTVVAGDTMSGIAQKFGVSLAALRAANPSIKNVNSIKIGDQINIPAAPGSSGGTVPGASPSVVSGASAGP